ncbi:MAG: hypothetical protein JNM06_16400, partial [Blastocatellia bacterium]|nr:hypothetical protein [Blastocatellia bacterium]
MNYYLSKLSKSELKLSTLKFVVVNLLFAIVISNTHLFNLLPSKIFSSQSCGSEMSSSCGMACCAGKPESGSCCKPKSSQINSLESSSCHSESDSEETDEAVFLQINVSFFADYYLAKEKDTLTKEYLKSQAKPKLSAAFSKPCPCDSQNIATQFRFNLALIIVIGNLQPRPPTIKSKFDLFYPSKDKS